MKEKLHIMNNLILFILSQNPNIYLILGILDEDKRPRTVLLGKPKFNPQLN